MPRANYSINYSAVLSQASGDISPGFALLKSPSGWVIATAANRTLYGRRTDGVALDARSTAGAVRIAHNGLLDDNETGLGDGDESWVRVDDDGLLERVADEDIEDGDDLVGRCTTDGDLHLQCNTWTAESATASGSGAVADDIAKQGGSSINRVQGLNRVGFKTTAGAAASDGTAPPRGGTWVYNSAFGVNGFRAKRPTPHGWFDPADYGAIGDGASHPLSDYFGSLGAAQAVFPHATALSDELDWAAIQAAINAAKTAEPKAAGRDALGGLVHIGRGHFKCNQPLSCSQTRSLTIQGSGLGIVGASDGACTLDFTGGAGVPRFFDGRSSIAMVVEKLAISYSDPAFDGVLVDMSNGFGADTTGFEFSRVGFIAAPSVDIALDQACYALLYLDNSIIGLVNNCIFQTGRHGILGREAAAGGYSNAIRITNNQFQYVYYAIANCGQNWHVAGNTFEGSGGFVRAAYADRFPETRATAMDPLTYVASSSSITRADGSWLDDGFRVGYLVYSIHADEAGNIATNGFPVPPVRVTDTDLDFSANDITLDGDKIQRSYGSFVDDGFELGQTPTIRLTGCPDNGVQGAITNITATELTISGAAYGAPTAYDEGDVYYIEENLYIARAMASEGWSFSDEESTDALVYAGTSDGPMTWIGNWFGDQYLDGAWFSFYDCVGLTMIGNFISTSATNGRVVDVKLSTEGLVAHNNYFQCNLVPFTLASEGLDGAGEIDGASVKNNNGTIGWEIPDGIEIRGLERIGNVGDEAEVTVDMNNANATIRWEDDFYAEIIKVISTTDFTADRTLTVPAAANAGAVKRFIRNAQAGAFNLVVSTGAGTTVTIAQGKGAAIGIDTGGVFRMGADV